MKRREFLKNSSKTIALGAVLPGFQFSALGANAALNNLLGSQGIHNDHVLVIIQLNGGNDGLNTIIPLDQYSNLSKLRSNLLISESKVLKLPDNEKVGFHPAMEKLFNLYQEKKVNIVQGVGYPQQNYSHFRSTDIWLSGSDANQTLTTGWMGRYLDYEYPNYPTGYPNEEMPDPLGIQIGSMISPAFQGPILPMAISISSDKNFYDIVNASYSTASNSAIGKELAYVRQIAGQAKTYNEAIVKAANNVTSQYSAYPTKNTLADQLKIVAKLIKGGLKTKVYMVSMGGFDTHANQVDSTDTSVGTHANLLSTLSEAIFAFQKDLEYLQIEDRVLGMTFSEFGRRVNSNSSVGTDHGSSLPMIFFGKQVQSGTIGTNPQILDTFTTQDNLAMQYDFRSVYATVLNQWFCVDNTDLETILLKNYQTLPIIGKSACSTATISEHNDLLAKKWIHCYPNPFVDKVTIEFNSLGGHTMIQIFNTEGQVLDTLIDRMTLSGKNSIDWNPTNIPDGIYYCRFQQGDIQQVQLIQKVN